MKRTRIVVILAVLATAVVAYAQMAPPPPGEGPGPMPRMAPPPVMISDESYIYILRGPEMLKVKKTDLTVEKVVTLPMPKPPQPPQPGE